MPGVDNVQINPMSGGALIAADDIGGGVVAQRVKVGWGADGSLVDVDESAPLPTSIMSGSAVGAAQVTVPHIASPQGASRTITVRSGCNQWPSIPSDEDAAAIAKAADKMDATIGRHCCRSEGQ